ncbi:MAG: NAD(P)-dependent oxidoreductase [Oscillospiraceae bacterium]|jgi:putative NADH-flavin reductase
MSKETVAVVGITGRVGVRVAKELLDRGFNVIGINRRPERVPVRCKDFTYPTVKADAGNYQEILEAIRGAGTVVMATEPTREHPEKYPQDILNVLRACKKCGVSQFIAVLNYYALKAPDGRLMLEADPVHPEFLAIEKAYFDAAELIKKEKEQDWVIIAAPAEMVPYLGKTGVYRTQEDVLVTTDPKSLKFKETSRLSMEDMAHCIADQAEFKKWHRQVISVAY